MTRAQRMHRKLVALLCKAGGYIRPFCMHFGCDAEENLEIDHPHGRVRRQRNRAPEHRRKSYLQRVRELWEAFALGEELRVLCRHCNAREGGGRRYS